MAKKKYSHETYVRWGKMGGSPILASWVVKRPVQGYKVTKNKKG